MGRRSILSFLAGGAALLAACKETPARPQVELYIDLDLPVPSQIGSDVNTDAVVDSVRIEVLASDLSLLGSRTFTLTSRDSLPLSFGIPSDIAKDGHVLVRIRAFRAFFATPGQQQGQPILDPLADVTVDRLVDLELPTETEGVVSRAVTLHGDCMGSRLRFPVGDFAAGTCVDGDNIDVAATEGIGEEAPSSTVAGTWSLARATPCASDAPTGTICIPGGLMILGDPQFSPIDEYDLSSLPLRVVALDPFFIDQTEVTVGDLRELIGFEGYDGPLPYDPDPSDPTKEQCTWGNPAGALPINCIAADVADAVCAARGGEVPSEAQWEFAARGHGARSVYPWGQTPVECCMASIGRVPLATCSDSPGIEAIKSHQGSDTCIGDATPDGVFDLAGSVSELMRDSVATFADACWAPAEGGPAILHNPVCIAAIGRVARGGAWGFTFSDAPLPIRRTFIEDDPNYGFRCVYGAGP